MSQSSTSRSMIIAGVDEAGRGPLAGPVTAAAVILKPSQHIAGLKDSKKLRPRQREVLAAEIRQYALAWAVGWADNIEIDRINILQAALLAMKRAVMALSVVPEKVFIDGDRCPDLSCKMEAVIHGDNLIPIICAASILAKVERDAAMLRFDKLYPGYGFSKHKGYGTSLHLAALEKYGACPIHRRSFAPVRHSRTGTNR